MADLNRYSKRYHCRQCSLSTTKQSIVSSHKRMHPKHEVYTTEKRKPRLDYDSVYMTLQRF